MARFSPVDADAPGTATQPPPARPLFRDEPYTFLVETYATERLKTLSVWAHFTDADLGFRPEPRARTPLEQMVHQCLSEDVWMQRMLGIDAGLPPLPEREDRLGFLEHYAASERRLERLQAMPAEWFGEGTRFFDVPRSRAWVLTRRIAHSGSCSSRRAAGPSSHRGFPALAPHPRPSDPAERGHRYYLLRTVLTCRAISLTLAMLIGISGSTAAQRKAVAPPEEVARAVLRADSAGDWATVLRLAHPDALARFRARQVFQLRMLGAQGWPDSDSATTDSTAEAHWRQVRARQERFMLDSVFQVPDADSLSLTSPDTVYARWVRGIRARTAPDSTSGYRVVGAVKASDTLTYVVMERPLEQPLGPLPEMFRDLPRETQMAVVMVMRRYGREWRSMLDGVGEAVSFGPELMYEE